MHRLLSLVWLSEEIRLIKANRYHLYSHYQGLFTGLDVRVKINLVILVVVVCHPLFTCLGLRSPVVGYVSRDFRDFKSYPLAFGFHLVCFFSFINKNQKGKKKKTKHMINVLLLVRRNPKGLLFIILGSFFVFSFCFFCFLM